MHEQGSADRRLFQDLPLLLEDTGLAAQVFILSHQVLVGPMGAASSEDAVTHLFSVESPKPRSAEICRCPLSSMLCIDGRAMEQAAGQRDARRIPSEFVAVSVCHVRSA